jgi:hypothetical protein
MGRPAFGPIALGSWHNYCPNPGVQRGRREDRLLLREAQ